MKPGRKRRSVLELTKAQQVVYDARYHSDPQPTYKQIAECLGISLNSVKHLHKAAMRKLGNPTDLPGRRPDLATSKPTEETRPDLAAAFIDRFTAPDQPSVLEAAKACGLPKDAALRLADRIEGQYLPVKKEIQNMKTEVISGHFKRVAFEAVSSITLEELKKMNPVQRSVVAGIATEKWQLLEGLPTERISYEERKSLPDLLKAVQSEVQRRGWVVEVDPTTGEPRLQHNPDAPPQVRLGKKRMDPVIEGEVVR